MKLTWWKVARRPKWLSLLVLALVLALVFAFLGRWQLERALMSVASAPTNQTELQPLETAAKPNSLVTRAQNGQLVYFAGRWSKQEPEIITNRNQEGKSGYWLVSQVILPSTASIAVAIGFSEDLENIRRIRAEFKPPTRGEVVGRYWKDEAPEASGPFASSSLSDMSVAALINVWEAMPSPAVYLGFVTDKIALPGLLPIYTAPVNLPGELNWLNLFYAAEWVVFAGFALYFWYRLVKDALERELVADAGENSG